MSNSKLEYKIVLIGNTAVGKTSLFRKLTTGEFNDKIISTIGIDKRSLSFSIELNENNKIVEKEVDISIIDTAGQERFRAITKTYYKECDGILLLYDVTNRETFKTVESWIQNINENLGNHKNNKYLIILIGNKIDLIGVDDFKREVTDEEAEDICKKLGLIWGGETSVKDIEVPNLKELFKNYVKLIYNKVGVKSKEKQVAVKIGGYKKKKKGSFC